MKALLAAAALAASAAFAQDVQDPATAPPAQPAPAAAAKDCEPKPKLTQEQINAIREKNLASIRDLVEQMNGAFSKKDGRAVSELFTEEGRLMNPRGEKASGREDIAKLIQSDMDGYLKDASLTVTNVDIKLLKPGLAFVDFDHVVSCTNETAAGSLPPNVHVSAVVVKRDGKWQFQEARAASYPKEKPSA